MNNTEVMASKQSDSERAGGKAGEQASNSYVASSNHWSNYPVFITASIPKNNHSDSELIHMILIVLNRAASCWGWRESFPSIERLKILAAFILVGGGGGYSWP